MYELDAIETTNFAPPARATDRRLLPWGNIPLHGPGTDQISPDRTIIVRPRKRDFDTATILVSSLVSGVFFAFAAFAALV